MNADPMNALQIEVVDRLPGTNAALRARADDGAREGLVLIAQAQSAGRGRGGHSFYPARRAVSQRAAAAGNRRPAGGQPDGYGGRGCSPRR